MNYNSKIIFIINNIITVESPLQQTNRCVHLYFYTLWVLKNLKFITCKVNFPTLLTKWNLPILYAWAKVTKDINSNNKIMLNFGWWRCITPNSKTPLREKQAVLWQRCMMSFTKWDVINVVSSKKDAIKIAEQCNLLHHQSVAFLMAVENHPERLSACWLIRESPTLLTLNSVFLKQGTWHDS